MKMGYHRIHITCWLLLILTIYQTATATVTANITSSVTPSSTISESRSNTNTTVTITVVTTTVSETTIVTTTSAATTTTKQPPVIGESCIGTVCNWTNSGCHNGTCKCNNDSFEVNNKTCMKVSDLELRNSTLEAAETYLTFRWDFNKSLVTELIKNKTVHLEVTVDGFPETKQRNCSVYFKDHANCTGLTQGGIYTVTFIIYKVMQHLYKTSLTITTIPAVPGAIHNNSNLDASNLRLEWKASEGLVDNYTVNVTEVNGSNIISNTTIDNSTFIKLTGLRNGSSYMIVIVANRFNKISQPMSDNFTTAVTPPAQPSSVVVNQSSVTNNSMTLSWTRPRDFNGPYSGYMICIMKRIYLDEQSDDIGCYNESNTAFHAQNLTAGAFYRFSVYSVNSMYISTTAATSEVIQTKEGTPGEITNLTVVPSEDKITARWNRPMHPFGNITAYRVKVFNSDNTSDCHILWLKANESNVKSTVEDPSCQNQYNQAINMNQKVIDVNITSLRPDSNYSVNVRAYTNIGAGIESSTNTTTAETVPGNVTNVNGMAISSTEINVTWHAPSLRTGTTQYFINVYDRIANILNKTELVMGYEVHSCKVTNLKEYWVYQFAVYASTSKGNSSEVFSDNVTTREASPGAAVEPRVKYHNESICDARQVTFGWIEPELMNRKGNIIKYAIFLMSENYTDYSKGVENPNPYSSLSRNFTTILETIPEHQYNIQIWAVTQTGLNGTVNNFSFNSIACNPPQYNNIPNLIEVLDKTTSTFKVQLYQNFFRNDEQGKITSYGIVVSNKNSSDMQLDDTIPDFEEGKTNKFPYRLNLNLTSMQNKVQGKDNTSIKYTLENLPENAELYLVMFACTNGGCTLSKHYGPYWTLKSPDPPTSNATTIAVAVVLVLFAIIAAVVSVVLYRKGYHVRILATLRKHSGDQQDSVDFNHLSTDTEYIVKKRPIKFSMLDEYLEEMNKDSKLGFAKEYEDIQKLSPRHSTEAALLGENKSKNRWVNILAFDHSRVKLQLLDEDDPTSDYINANFIPDLKRQRAYIATQGPLPGTIDDFWRMIWEQKVSTIVMLTRCKEGNRIKCEMYWPNELHEAKQYGDIVVTPISISNLDKYDINVFDVSLNEETRRVMHFHFQEFPDFSADVDFSTFVSFVKTVRQHSQYKMQGPIVVHCSAGVGRTGTYITVDCLQQLVESPDFDFNSEVDIFNYVLTMRDNRTLMVQVEQQYIMIHECLKILLEQRKKTEEVVEESLYENQAFALSTFTSRVDEVEGSICSLTCPLIASNDAPDPDEEMDQMYENATIIPRTEL